MKYLTLLLIVVIVAVAQNAKPTSYTEITGDAATHQLASSGTCRSIQFIMPVGNVAVVRVGDSTTAISKGLPVAAGAGLFLPPLTLDTRQGIEQRYYDLSSLYYYAATGDKVDFVCFK
jgi:hypothetical protein